MVTTADKVMTRLRRRLPAVSRATYPEEIATRC
jgi:hypothetical protein